ncbi:MAG: ATP synthase F1 subunit gamma [Prolixibacteraceae bacterium]|nr:ATP synthase F1 subunit gamma [Prolixibacteraceae bacterium]
MAQLKEIRNRIVSIKNTKQVTNAMKMVSASKLKKAQDQILKIIPYDKKLQEIIESLEQGGVEFKSKYFLQPEIKNVLIVVIGTNRGLCGAFNSNVTKYSIIHAFENYSLQFKSGDVKFITIGKQAEKGLTSKDLEIIGDANELLNNLSSEKVSELAEVLINYFLDNKFQRIDIVYNKFKAAAIQTLTAVQFLPVILPSKKSTDVVLNDFIFEPSRDEIMGSIVPQALKMQLYRMLIDSNAAEQGARMVAMHKATENANEMIDKLTTEYNNARQAAITNEIVEITSGAEALRN